MPIGKQDQYASAFGGLNAIHFEPGRRAGRTGRTRADAHWTNSTSVCSSSRPGRSRNSARILRQQRDDTSRKKPVVAKSLHGLKAIAGELRESLLDGKIDDLGELLDRGWQQKKRLSNKISSDAIDSWYRLAREQGATGGKITGAGGGGFMLLYCEPDNA